MAFDMIALRQMAPRSRRQKISGSPIYLRPAVIHALKIEALEANTHAYLIVEKMLKENQQGAKKTG